MELLTVVLCCVRFRCTTWWFRVHHTGEMILVFTDKPEVDSSGLPRCSGITPSTMLQCVLLRPNTASLLYVRDRIGEKISGLGSASTTKVCSVISEPFVKPMINACIFSAACRVVLRCWCYSRKSAPRGKCGQLCTACKVPRVPGVCECDNIHLNLTTKALLASV